MKTVSENLKEMADLIRGLIGDLLTGHSSIYRWNEPGSIVITVRNYAWEPLKNEGRRIQSQLLEEYRRFHSTVQALLREQPEDTLGVLKETHDELLEIIEQNETTWFSEVQEALNEALKALDTQIGILEGLYDRSEGEVLFVPDTNALLFNPALDTWRFDGAPQFTIVLTPAILSELDSLKIDHRNETVRLKAERLIRQIKEYRRRGNLTAGVNLVKNVSRLLSIATEPIMESSLPWLDALNTDDRFLASFLEVMRLRPRSTVVLVTRDINLQNKAEFARLPFIEPPEPT